MVELVKVCPDCGAEYLPHIERCADCGAVLTLAGQQALSAPPPSAGHTPTNGDLVCVRVADLQWARRLGARLERAGIDHLVEAEETQGAKCCHGTGRFRVLVRRPDSRTAAEVDAEQLREDVPDLEDAPQEGGGPGCCPACGDPVPGNAAECPSCGLALMLEKDCCPGCQAPLPPGVRQCPDCGRETGQRCC